MAIFKDDNDKIHQAQIVKEWLGGSMNTWPISCNDNARVKSSIKSTPAHPKDFQ